jgi:hypothetical protein
MTMLLGRLSLLSLGVPGGREVPGKSAEYVAPVGREALQLPESEYARGYMQNWFSGEGIIARSAPRIFSTASAILKAGRESAGLSKRLGDHELISSESNP